MDQLYEKYYSSLTFYIIFASFMLITVILGMIFCKRVQRSNSKLIEKQLYVLALLVFVGMLSFFSYKTVLHVKDYSTVKQGNYETMTGKVVDYRIVHGDVTTGKNEYSYPVFEDTNTGELYAFHVGPTEMNRIYTLCYLKNCKVCIIANEAMHETERNGHAQEGSY